MTRGILEGVLVEWPCNNITHLYLILPLGLPPSSLEPFNQDGCMLGKEKYPLFQELMDKSLR